MSRLTRAAQRARASASRLATQVDDRVRGRTPFHLLHIGKTGGTAMRAAVRLHDRTDRYVLTYHQHHVALASIPEGEPVGFVLRDPISRFVSGFWSRQREGRPRRVVPWTAGEERAFTRFESPDALGRALGSDDDDQRWAAIDAMRCIIHVRTSYWDWFLDERHLRARAGDLAFVGWQESLDADFERLKEILGLDASVALPSDPVSAHRTPDTVDRRLSPEAEANLRRWYRTDYELIDLMRELTDRR